MLPDYNSQMHVAVGGSWQRAGNRLLRQVFIPTHARILDAGCGTGELALALANQVPEGQVLGVDRNPRCIELATAAAENLHVTNVTFRQGDLLEPTPAADAYDLAFCNSTLHLMTDAPSVLRNLVDCLRPGGQLAVQLPAHDPSDEAFDALQAALQFVDESDLLRLWNTPYFPSSQELTSQLQELGLSAVRVMEELETLRFRSTEDTAAYFAKLLLAPYLAQIPAGRHEEFLQAFAETFPTEGGLPHCTLKRLYAQGTR